MRSAPGTTRPGKRVPTGEIPRRPFGRTGVTVSLLGLGGSSLGAVRSEAEAIRIVHEALDAGINFLDNAWEYHDGRSEKRMGKALTGLKPGANERRYASVLRGSPPR